MRRSVFFMVSAMLLFGVAAVAQESRSEISLQGTGFFTSSTSGNGTAYNATQTGGFLSSYRYRLKRRLWVEAAYGFDRNTQKYSLSSADFGIQSNIHQMTGSLIFALPAAAKRRLNPYLLAGGGVLLFNPTETGADAVFASQTQARGVFQYGGGVNFPVSRRISLRAEYRGLIYSTPDFGIDTLTTNSVTHTAQPSAGVVFHF